MPLTKEKKSTVIAQYGGKESNTGSIEGQIALLTERMSQIASHLQTNKKDFSTHRGLMHWLVNVSVYLTIFRNMTLQVIAS